MNKEMLQEFIRRGETLSVEFKSEEKHPLNDRDLVEAVVCLANRSEGCEGWLFIGIEDDGRVTGARPRHGDRTDPDRLVALIASRTRPSLSVRVEIVCFHGKELVVMKYPHKVK